MIFNSLEIPTLKDGTEINLAEFNKWLEALTSGEYKQTVGTLQNFRGFCCLGVACKVLIPKEDLELSEFGPGIMNGKHPRNQPKSPKWVEHISHDVRRKTGVTLTALNDRHKFTFEEIASVLYQIYVLGEYTNEGY